MLPSVDSIRGFVHAAGFAAARRCLRFLVCVSFEPARVVKPSQYTPDVGRMASAQLAASAFNPVGLLLRRTSCFFPISLAVAETIANTHSVYPRRNDPAEFTRVTGYIPRWFAVRRRSPMTRQINRARDMNNFIDFEQSAKTTIKVPELYFCNQITRITK